MRDRSSSYRMFLACIASGLAAISAGAQPWDAPDCSEIDGNGEVTFTRDRGRTIAPTAARLGDLAYTSVVALEEPNRLLAASHRDILVSRDAGCSWERLAAAPHDVVNLVAGSSNRAYGWFHQAPGLLRIDGESVTTVETGTEGWVALGVDESNDDLLRVATRSGAILESFDAGESWQQVSMLPTTDLFYDVAFDPRDLDHLVAGFSRVGAKVSFDGGLTWRSSRKLSFAGPGWDRAFNVFRVVFSPANPRVVWALGIDFAQLNRGARHEGRHLYRSEDGGRSFVPVIRHSPGRVILTNGNLLAPDARDPSLLYFVFGSRVTGTLLYAYDHDSRRVRSNHNDYDGLFAIAFSPAEASILYLGVVSLRGAP